jgi:hypothetical protein
MATFGSAANLSTGLGMARAAEAMLRALGGGEVMLRFKGPAIADDAASNPRLGLAANICEDVTLSPAVVRSGTDGSLEFVLPASIVNTQVELRQTGTTKALFESALGFIHDGKLLRIESVSADFHGNTAYLYRATARE